MACWRVLGQVEATMSEVSLSGQHVSSKLLPYPITQLPDPDMIAAFPPRSGIDATCNMAVDSVLGRPCGLAAAQNLQNSAGAGADRPIDAGHHRWIRDGVGGADGYQTRHHRHV